MVISYGTRYVGNLVKTQTGLSVATLFFHILWIPLVPMQTAILRDGEPVAGLPLSVSSILIAYLRTLLVLAPLLAMVYLPLGMATFVVSVPLCLSLYGLTHLLTRASQFQATELERRLL